MEQVLGYVTRAYAFLCITVPVAEKVDLCYSANFDISAYGDFI
jgi:hypothetical protein